MAKQVLTVITDDIDGSKGAQTVTFSLEGAEYSIDLNDKNLKKLRDALTPYTAAGEKIGKTRRARNSTSTGSRSDSAEIRAWAAESGVEVSSRGRIPQSVTDAYDAR